MPRLFADSAFGLVVKRQYLGRRGEGRRQVLYVNWSEGERASVEGRQRNQRVAAADFQTMSHIIDSARWLNREDGLQCCRRLTSAISESSRWREDWQSATVINSSLVYTIPQSDFPVSTFCDASSHRETVPGQDRATAAAAEGNEVSQTMKCVTAADIQTMSHIFDSCSLTKLAGGLHCRRVCCRLAGFIWYLEATKTTPPNNSDDVSAISDLWSDDFTQAPSSVAGADITLNGNCFTVPAAGH